MRPCMRPCMRLYSTAARVKKINDVQKLYYVHPFSPGSPFFLPPGARIFAKMAAFVRAQMNRAGFDEVLSPQLYKKELWQISGHWDHYKDDMFGVCDGHNAVGSTDYSLKPMNCPGHCLVFKSSEHSFRDMPVRYSDFSSLHRNEASGALTGLTRVRRFHQDDGHIFCRPDQVAGEIENSLKLVDQVYKVFGLGYSMTLSTKPDDYMGEDAEWARAESDLESAILRSNHKLVVNQGDGAFYGPKIDFMVTDSTNTTHQAATIQLDFQLPHKFGLEYKDTNAMVQPVMIHRAIFGSVERFLAILVDHYAGKWPFWLNPRQAVVIPVSESTREYALSVASRLRLDTCQDEPVPLQAETYDVEVMAQDEPLAGRIRAAAQVSASYVVVVGEKEHQSNTISVRRRGSKRAEIMRVDDLKAEFRECVRTFS